MGKEMVITAEGGSPAAPLKERRTKAARDPAHHDGPVAPKETTPSTEAVLHSDEVHESRQPLLSTLSFTELHVALNYVHVVSILCCIVRSLPVPEGSTWSEGTSRVF
jgi:hypothetical protein